MAKFSTEKLAPLSAPVFVGDARAVTPSPGDADTSLATTAFVAAALGGATGGAKIADTPPASPGVGQLWWESDTGTLYVSYNDGDTTQWVALAGGSSAASILVQRVYVEDTTFLTTAVARTGAVDTVPQQTEGTQILSVSITPKFMSSKLHVEVFVPCSINVLANFSGSLFQDSIANALASVVIGSGSATVMVPMVLNFELLVTSLALTTFKFRVGTQGSGTISINGAGGARQMGGSQRMTMSIEEYLT